MLAYKKPNRRTPKNSPLSATSSRFPDSEGTLGPVTNSEPTRKVLSRRRALQEFYKLQQGKADNTKSEHEAELNDNDGKDVTLVVAPSDGNAPESMPVLKDPAELKKFLKTSSGIELLNVRNNSAGKLNHHDLGRKAIIYDNYYELIKLNHVLSNLSGEQKKGSHLDEDLNNTKEQPATEDYVVNVLEEISNYFKTTASQFNEDFVSVVEGLSAQSRRADSTASIQGIHED